MAATALQTRLATLALAVLSSSAGAQTYDLKSDWSNANNPNGVWQYRDGNNDLPSVTDWQGGTGDWTTPQDGWAVSAASDTFIPFMFQSNGTETFAHDWNAGDIVVHTQDDSNGVGNGPANFLFTAPSAETIDISGEAWSGRILDRSQDWEILINGVAVTGGELIAGASSNEYTEASPFDFSAGSGGANVLQNISLSAGGTVELLLTHDPSTSFGDFVGTDITINATATPEPVSMAVLGLGGVALLRRRRSSLR